MIMGLMLLSGWELGIWVQCYIVFNRFLIPSLNFSIEKGIKRKFCHEEIKYKVFSLFLYLFGVTLLSCQIHLSQ